MINIAICDECIEILYYIEDSLIDFFQTHPPIYKIRKYTSPKELLQNSEKIDICILEISMDEMSGIAVGKILKEKFPKIRLLYMSAHAQNCIRAINEVHAFSFLPKPIDYTILQTQIADILKESFCLSAEKEFRNVTDHNNRKYAYIKLNLENILYLEYIKRQRKAIIVMHDKIYECECIFKKLVQELEAYDFVVNCRGSLVNLSHVVQIKGRTIYLDNNQTLMLSQKRVKTFNENLNTFLQRI